MSDFQGVPSPIPSILVHHPSSPSFCAQLEDNGENIGQQARLWLMVQLALEREAMDASCHASQVLGIRDDGDEYTIADWTPESTLKGWLAYQSAADTWRQRTYDAIEDLRKRDRDTVDEARDAFEAELEAKFDEDCLGAGAWYRCGDGWPTLPKLPPDVSAKRPKTRMFMKSNADVEREAAHLDKYTALYREKIRLMEPEQAKRSAPDAIESRAVLLASLLDVTTDYTLASLPYPYRLNDKVTFIVDF